MIPIAKTVTVNENTTALYTASLVDELGVALGSNRISTMVFTLYNKVTSAIINSRNAQNILNVNGGALDASGNFSLTLSQLDNAIIDSTLETETHYGLFEWTYGSKGGNRTISIKVNNVTRVGA